MENLLTGVIVVSFVLLVLFILNCFLIVDLVSKFDEIKKLSREYKNSIDNKFTIIDAFNYNIKHDFNSFVNLSNDRFDNNIENLDYLQSQICDLQSNIDKIKKSKNR